MKRFQFSRFLCNSLPMHSPDTGTGTGGTGEGGTGGDGEGGTGGTGEGGTGGTGVVTEEGVSGKDDRTVTYSRFKKVNDDKKAFQSENMTLKNQLADAQALLQGKDTADTTLKNDVASLRSQLTAERLRTSFITASSKQGLLFHDLEDVIRLVDFTQVGITDKGIDKDDMADIVKEFAKSKPHMLKTVGADGSPNFPGGKPPQGGGDNTKTPAQLANERIKSRASRNGTATVDPWARK